MHTQRLGAENAEAYRELVEDTFKLGTVDLFDRDVGGLTDTASDFRWGDFGQEYRDHAYPKTSTSTAQTSTR